MNEVLITVEERLAAGNPGIETWLDDDPLWTEEEGGGSSLERVDILGFAKVDGKWCMAVRRDVLTHGFYEGDPESPYTERELLSHPVPLRKTARHIRLAALKLLPELVADLATRTREAVKSIRKTEATLG